MQSVAWPLGLNQMAAFCLGVQWLAFLPAYHWQTEMFYDLTGSLTFIATMITSLNLSPAWPPHPRQQIGTLCVMLWAFRLGYFLFTRIVQHGKDSRFDTVKGQPLLFLQYWTVQGLWVFLTCLPVLILNSKKPENVRLPDSPAPTDVLGLLVFVLGLGTEMLADFQKYQWQNDWEHRDDWIYTGLWKHSRHPNYAGELVLHVGIFILASGAFQGPLEWGLAALGPLFVGTLLYQISLPMVEKKANQRWKDDKLYKKYLQETPAILPLPKWL